MLVKIVKCNNDLSWYNNCIGEIINVRIITNECKYYEVILEPPNNITDIGLYVRIDDTVEFNRNKKLLKILDKIKNNT